MMHICIVKLTALVNVNPGRWGQASFRDPSGHPGDSNNSNFFNTIPTSF